MHFVGIGGAGMSGIARIMLARGIAVSGSDSAASAMLDELASLGATVHVGHAEANLGRLGPVTRSSCPPRSAPTTPSGRGRPAGDADLAPGIGPGLGDAGRRVIAIAGTHGKTTTTSMVTTVLRECGADPGYVIGGVLTETGLGAADGSGTDFVAEADESDGSFLLLSPDAAIITNVEADHLDNYADLADIKAAFSDFGRQVGSLVLSCADDPGAESIAAKGSRRRAPPGRLRRGRGALTARVRRAPRRRLPAQRYPPAGDGGQLRGDRRARPVRPDPRKADRQRARQA